MAALNEDRNIAQVVDQIVSLGYNCIVVDDGSTDQTAQLARVSGADVVSHSMNLGQGFSMITGFHAIQREAFDFVICMDGDGQHDPVHIPAFIDKLNETNADMVVGSRRLGTNYSTAPFFRKTFLPLFTLLINAITGYRLTDAMSGFRAFRMESLSRMIPIFDSLIEPQYYVSEMYIRFSRSGLRIEEVPIDMQPRGHGQSYKGFVRYGMGVLKAIIRAILSHS